MNRKDIYYEGKIYQGGNNMDELQYVPLSNIFTLIGEHNFKDGEEVVLGKDYDIQFQWCMEGRFIPCNETTYYATGDKSRRTVAVPLVKEEGEDEIKFFPVEYAGYWYIQTGSNYGDPSILDAEHVGEEQAEKYANLICELLNKKTNHA